ncbi:hypothetical protein Q7O_002765 [Pectobacterium carotovorum subsp. carotovorum PCCS1]|nr:hypothetical protein [Pectobacterium carotovorum subsp. carotovorum PCCS1]
MVQIICWIFGLDRVFVFYSGLGRATGVLCALIKLASRDVRFQGAHFVQIKRPP